MIKWLAIVAFVALVILGGLIFIASRRGWMRNGYFTIISTVLIVIGIFLCFQTLGGILAVAVGGIHISGSGLSLLAMNGIAQLLIMLVGTVFLSRSVGQNAFAVFRLEGFYETPLLAYVLALPIMMVAQVVGISVSSLWTSVLHHFPTFYHSIDKFESLGDKQLEGLVTAHNTLEYILIMLFVAIVPALAEETLFRGFAQSNIERSGRLHARPMVALAIASILFAAIHLSLFKLPGLLTLGLCLGWMAYRTNNLFVGSLGHAVNNGLIVTALYLSPNLGADASTSALVGNAEMTGMEALKLFAGTAPVLAVFFYLFYRVTASIGSRQNSEREITARLASHGDLFPDDLAAAPYREHSSLDEWDDTSGTGN